MSFAKKHHYIPQFYLKGFTNTDGQFFIYDKEKNEVRKSKPINSFFEKYRNTTELNGEKLNVLEDIYANFDEKVAKQLNVLRSFKPGSSHPIPPEVLQRIKMFIANLYWRVPENEEKLENEINKLSFKEAGFQIINKNTGLPISNSAEAEWKSIDAFRKMYSVILPFLTGSKEFKTIDPQNWRLCHRGNFNQLTSDNPLIIESYVDFGSLNKECIFPISSNKVLVHSKRDVPREFPSEFILHLDMLQITQATRFVCCSNEDYLKFLIDGVYSYSKNFDFLEKMKKQVFSYFQ